MKIIKTIKDLEESILSNEDKFIFKGSNASEIEVVQCKKTHST